MIKKIKNHISEQGTAIQQLYKNKIIGDLRFFGDINLSFIDQKDKELIKQLQKRKDCEALLFLAELYNDNKDILYNEVQME